MTPSRFLNIFSFKSKLGGYLAFHIDRLEVASISETAFIALNDMGTPQTNLSTLYQESIIDSSIEEISDWNNQINNHDKVMSTDYVLNETLESLPLKKSSLDKYNDKIDKLVINNTQICNLKCTYCAAGGDGTFGDPIVKISIEKTFPQIEFIINKLDENSSLNINFMGGEPLLDPLTLKAIYDYASEKCYSKNIELKIIITTNGTIINEKALYVLNHMKASINVSLDGPIEINDHRRPSKDNKSTTVKVIEGLRLLTNAKNNNAGITGVGVTAVFDKNYFDVLKTYNFFNSLNLNLDWYEFNFSHTETDDEASIKYSESLSQVAFLAWELGKEKELLKIRVFNHLFAKLDAQVKVTSYCGINKSLAVLDARNNFYSCPWYVGDSNYKIDLNNISHSSKNIVNMSSTKSKKSLTLDCHSCWARNLCSGGCEFIHRQKQESSQNRQQLDKKFCLRTQNLIKDAILFYELSRKD